MIDKIIKDIELSLNSGAYLGALALALTLPDICGKAEYPAEKSTKKRYKQWYNELDYTYGDTPKTAIFR